MENTFQNYVKDAEKAFQTADHLAYVTLPLLKEKKLLIPIIENIDKALSKSMHALFHHTHTTPPTHFDEQVTLLEKIIPTYKINKELILIIKEVRTIMKHHEKSAVEFIRNNNYVVCDDKYRIKKLDEEQVKSILFHTRPFIQFLRSLQC